MPMLSYKFGPARCENVLDPLAIWSISESEKKSFRSTENIDRGAKLTSGLATNMREDAKSRKGSGEGSSNDSINNVGSQARVDFGGANQPKGSEERSRTC